MVHFNTDWMQKLHEAALTIDPRAEAAYHTSDYRKGDVDLHISFDSGEFLDDVVVLIQTHAPHWWRCHMDATPDGKFFRFNFSPPGDRR